jgi:hypothetical protein
MPACTSPPRSIPSEGCSVFTSSRLPGPDTAFLLGWLGGFGPVCLAGIEGAGSYGAGLARHVTAAGVQVVAVDRPGRQGRRRPGNSDPPGRARGAPKGRDGTVEAVWALMAAKRSATGERTPAINQARALVLTGPG